MLRIVLFLLTTITFSQSSKTEADLKRVGAKGWASSSEFSRKDVKGVGIYYLKEKYLNKDVKPIYITKEFREYKYKNFYHDKKLKRAYKNSKRKGFRENNSGGSLSTFVYYDPNTNYEFLYNKTFKVIDIFTVKSIRHVASMDDSNYIFVIQNTELGKIYYEYSNKFKDRIEIELVK